ncbi:hypothetical protein TPR58_05770 [Sphingomonas sp. HF-S3]|uniref:Uncharacterized protein n=1 Tax=Sphingomonas rustica TaxID=3103142 RepID=A0ABV0B7X6_9SPHN
MSWGRDAQNPAPDWTMSVSLENVPRGGQQMPEVTNLRDAVRTWQQLDQPAKDNAILMLERPVTIDGVQLERFEGQGIAPLAERMIDPNG